MFFSILDFMLTRGKLYIYIYICISLRYTLHEFPTLFSNRFSIKYSSGLSNVLRAGL